MPLGSPARSKQLPHKDRVELDLCLLFLLITAWAELSRKREPRSVWNMGPRKAPKIQQDLKKTQNYADPIAKVRTCSSLKENTYKQHSSGEKETEKFKEVILVNIGGEQGRLVLSRNHSLFMQFFTQSIFSVLKGTTRPCLK